MPPKSSLESGDGDVVGAFFAADFVDDAAVLVELLLTVRVVAALAGDTWSGSASGPAGSASLPTASPAEIVAASRGGVPALFSADCWLTGAAALILSAALGAAGRVVDGAPLVALLLAAARRTCSSSAM